MDTKLGSISVRLATPKDAEEMLEIQRCCIEEIFPSFYSQKALNMWKNQLDIDNYITKGQSSGRRYVAVLKENSSEQIVGFGYLNYDSSQLPKTPNNYKCNIQIQTLYVSVNHHKRGIGRKIIQEMERQALNDGYTHVGILASIPALSFYERVGYSIIGKGWYNIKPDKPEDLFSESTYSLEGRVMVKDLELEDNIL